MCKPAGAIILIDILYWILQEVEYVKIIANAEAGTQNCRDDTATYYVSNNNEC
jgi:hypothetical protein